jgi:hypothetical protein
MTPPSQTADEGILTELAASAHAEAVLPADAHVIGEPVTVIQIRYPGVARAGLLATYRRGDTSYELSLADVTPKKQWTHARHPYLSGEVSAVQVDASVLGLALLREDAPNAATGRDASGDSRAVYPLGACATLATVEAGKTWRELETVS